MANPGFKATKTAVVFLDFLDGFGFNLVAFCQLFLLLLLRLKPKSLH